MGCLGYFVPSTEEREKNDSAEKALRRFMYCDDKNFYYIFGYQRIDIAKKIIEENNKLAPLLKAKINELCEKREKSKPVVIARGNCCKNPCYAYKKELLESCPECGGKVSLDFENGYTVGNVYSQFDHCYEEVKYYDDNVCDKFKFNENIDKIDYDLQEFIKYFTKVDPNEKFLYDSNKKDQNVYPREMERKYMIVDGERFDLPYGIDLDAFFRINDSYFFYNDRNDISFYYEGIRKELGQSLGYYGYKWKHYVFIYECKLCGLKYHILRTSPFAFRDKSKDNVITVERPIKQENPENQQIPKNIPILERY